METIRERIERPNTKGETSVDTCLSYRPRQPSLGEMLEKCAKKSPHPFTQVDGFAGVGRDDVMHPDAEDDSVMVTLTWEPMTSCPTVRLLIPADADVADVLRLLKKARSVIKRSPHYLKWPPPPPPPPQEVLPF